MAIAKENYDRLSEKMTRRPLEISTTYSGQFQKHDARNAGKIVSRFFAKCILTVW